MATNISISIPDASVSRIVDDLCGALGYAAYQEGGGSMTKNQYAKQCLIDFVKNTCRSYEQRQAAATSESTINSDISGINIT